jgi:hypothetical protein
MRPHAERCGDGRGAEDAVSDEGQPARPARPRQAGACGRHRAARKLRSQDEREGREQRCCEPARGGDAGEEADGDGELGSRHRDCDGASSRNQAVAGQRRPPRTEAPDLRDRCDGEKRAEHLRDRDCDHRHPVVKARSRSGRTGRR